MFKPGDVIPKGNTLLITSWECDADAYRTTITHEFPDEHLQSLLVVLKWFGANENDLGNEEHDSFVIAERLLTAYHEDEITKDFLLDIMKVQVQPPREGCTDEEFNNFCDGVDVYKVLLQFLDCPQMYDYGHCRAVSKVQVLKIEKDIVIPVLPEPIAEFNAENQKRVDNKWVSNFPLDKWEM